MDSAVSRIQAASSDEACKHFENRLRFETDCWDVHHSIANNKKDFVLLDVRSEELYNEGHVPTAECLPNWKVNENNVSQYPPETLFVVYCAGPHCNGANKAALSLARLGRPVKEMIGGVTGWLDEGFELEAS
jgi:rhodanese-related sulfurtransferase